MKHAIVSVTNDISSDQRVHRTCLVLIDHGYKVTVVGRHRPWSVPVERPYQTFRFHLIFNRGALFYATYNIRLFFYLLFKPADLLWANDLDTLLPNFLISRIRKCPLIYDSHEYFCHVPELVERPRIQRIWLFFERLVFPRLKNVITVTKSIASCYESEYGTLPVVIRNITIRKRAENAIASRPSRPELGLPDGDLIILQGAGINIQRGAEEAVLAMHYLENVTLLLVGSGDAWGSLKELVARERLSEKVLMIPRQPYERLLQYTSYARVGLSLDKPLNPNYTFSLPNKIFDYIHASVPVLASSLPEVQRIVKDYGIGEIISSHRPEEIAERIKMMLTDHEKRAQWDLALKMAKEELSWEHERRVLDDLLETL